MMFSIEPDLISAREVAIARTSCALGVFLTQERFPFDSIAMVTSFTIHLESEEADIFEADTFLSVLEKEINNLCCEKRDALDFTRYHLRAVCGHRVLLMSS